MHQQCSKYEGSCSSVIYQTVDVSLPISLVPSVNVEEIQIMCCEAPRVECCEARCGRGGIELKITQTLTYKIPIEYEVKATTGDASADCGKNCPNTNCTQCHC